MAEPAEFWFRLPTPADVEVVRDALRRYRVSECENARTHEADAQRAAALGSDLDRRVPPLED